MKIGKKISKITKFTVYGNTHADPSLECDISVLYVICVFLAANQAKGKVLELSERFIPLRNEGMWLIKV